MFHMCFGCAEELDVDNEVEPIILPAWKMFLGWDVELEVVIEVEPSGTTSPSTGYIQTGRVRPLVGK